jgi:hypothetical protein
MTNSAVHDALHTSPYIIFFTHSSTKTELWSKQIFQTAFLVILGISLRLILSIVDAVLAAV